MTGASRRALVASVGVVAVALALWGLEVTGRPERPAPLESLADSRPTDSSVRGGGALDEVGDAAGAAPSLAPPPTSSIPSSVPSSISSSGGLAPAGDQPVPQSVPDGAAPPSTTPGSSSPGPGPTVVPATETPTTRVDGADSAGRWIPAPGTAWQWQLSGPLDLSVDVPVFDVDGFDTSAEVVAELHRRGRRVICYVNVGAWEAWRPDAGGFPASTLGQSNGWPGERWLDIRRLDLLEPLLAARFDMCAAKGFDAVEPDNIDGFLNDSGFPLTARDQLVFNRRLAEMAHERGMSIGLKNDVEQVEDLVDWFDFAVNEECARYGECELLVPFVAAGKAVFHVEYDLEPHEFCHVTVPLGFSSMVKDRELTAWRLPC